MHASSFPPPVVTTGKCFQTFPNILESPGAVDTATSGWKCLVSLWTCHDASMYLSGVTWLSWRRICLQCRRPGLSPWVGKIPWRREWQPTAVSLPGEFHGQRILAGYGPQGHKDSDTAEGLTRSLWFYVYLWALRSMLHLLKSFACPTNIFQSRKFLPAQLMDSGSLWLFIMGKSAMTRYWKVRFLTLTSYF